MESQAVKRLKSFLWRAGGLVGVSLLSFLISPDFLDALSKDGILVPTILVTFVGLVVNELTKYLNTGLQDK